MLYFIIENSANQLTFINFAESVSIYVSSPVGIQEAEGETFTSPLGDHVQPEAESEEHKQTFSTDFDTLAEAGETPVTLSGDVTNQNRNSIIIRNTFLDKTSWSAGEKNKTENLLYDKPLTNISRCHEVLFPEDRELFDQGTFYTAFEDIDTSISDSGPLEAGLEAGTLGLESSAEVCEVNNKVLSAEDAQEIERIVRDHDTVYFSVNFGEVLIKEMLMCSMFGVQVISEYQKVNNLRGCHH